MDEYGGGGGGGIAGLLIMVSVIALVFIGFIGITSFMMKKVCEKCGKDPGFMIWIPIVRALPLMEVAGMPTWQIILMFIPVANLIFIIMLLLGLSKARNKSPAIPILLWVFCLGPIGAYGYLAFSE